MDVCGKCGDRLSPTSRFCSVCGTQVAPRPEYAPQYPSPGYPAQAYPQPPYPPPPYTIQQHGASPNRQMAHGFAQTFGLHPAAALLTVIVNTMIFGSAGVAVLLGAPTGGISIAALTVVSTVCGVILGIVTYLAQKKWYDDDKESAVVKALIVGFLTAIPAGLPAYLTIPSGIIGFFRRKSN